MKTSVFHNFNAGQLIEQFWFMPSDAFARAVEARIWSRQIFVPPVLDIGCGDGSISKFIYSQQGRLEVGVDNDSQVIKKARASRVYDQVICADATEMPFRNESFKTIVSNSVLEHIKDDILAVEETSRVLKREGCFLFTAPSSRFPRELCQLGIKQKQLTKLNDRLSHFHYHSLKDWEGILSHFGLKVVRFEYYFPKETVKIWYQLFRIATLKIHHRELWSYLRDSALEKVIPKKLAISLLKAYLEKYYNLSFSKNGALLFVIAQKTK